MRVGNIRTEAGEEDHEPYTLTHSLIAASQTTGRHQKVTGGAIHAKGAGIDALGCGSWWCWSDRGV